jgi:hypothetical protein
VRRFAAVIPVVLLLLIACNGPNTPLADKGPPVVLPPYRTGEPLRGALPEPIGKITATQFAAVLKNISSWDGGTQQDRCSDATLCGFGFSKVSVTIEPAIDALNADSNNVTDNGTILARVQNIGHRPTGGFAGYELNPGPQYYYFVVRRTAHGPMWQLVPFFEGDTHDPQAVGKGGAFVDCGHNTRPTKTKAGFYTCKQSKKHIETSSLLDFSALNLVAQFFGVGDSFLDQAPGWVSCVYGCCTLSW